MYVYMYMVDLYNRKSLHSYFFSNLCHIRLRLPKLSVTGKAAANPDLRLPKIGKQQNQKKLPQFFKVNPTDACVLDAGAARPLVSLAEQRCRGRPHCSHPAVHCDRLCGNGDLV